MYICMYVCICMYVVGRMEVRLFKYFLYLALIPRGTEV